MLEQASVPSVLLTAYSNERHVARAPFLINELVNDVSASASLRKKEVKPGDVFVGVIGFRALDLLCRIGVYPQKENRYRQAVLFDQNVTQVKAMHAIMKLIGECESPSAFIRAFTPRYLSWVNRTPRLKDDAKPGEGREEDWRYFAMFGMGVLPRDPRKLEAILEDMQRDSGSWLHHENYRHIRTLVRSGAIHTAIVDLTDPERVGVLNAWIESQGWRTGDVYVSSLEGFQDQQNIYDYYGQLHSAERRRAFFDNVLTLLGGAQSHAQLLHSAHRSYGGYELEIQSRQEVAGRRQALDSAEASAEKPIYEKIVGVGRFSIRLVGTQEEHTVHVSAMRERGSFTEGEWAIVAGALKNAGMAVDDPSWWDKVTGMRGVADGTTVTDCIDACGRELERALRGKYWQTETGKYDASLPGRLIA